MTVHLNVLKLACDLVRQGLPCFPCSANKHPRTPQGYKDATANIAALEELWERHPGPLIGIPTGVVSGADVLDVDARNNGGLWFENHRRRLPTTRAHRTRSGGFHLFFRHRAGCVAARGRLRRASMCEQTAVMSYGGQLPVSRCWPTTQWRIGPSGCFLAP